jgi:tetratricopeptide (TPR) repeat protein
LFQNKFEQRLIAAIYPVRNLVLPTQCSGISNGIYKEAKMYLRKGLLFIALFITYNLCYATELISREAVNYFNEGVKAQIADDISAANIAYQKVLLIEPHNPIRRKIILNNQGIIYAQQGDLEKAEETFKAALEIDPSYLPAQFNLGLVYDKRKTGLQSLEYWSKVFELDKLKPTDFVIEYEFNLEGKKW